MGKLGFTEILLILAVGLLFFGGGKIADIGKGLGQGIRNFKRGLREDDEPEKLADTPLGPKEKLTESAASTKARDVV